jgi:hypothetical protein
MVSEAKHTPTRPHIGRGDDWYVHVDENGDAISIAANGTGPKGGWVGISIARMAVPGDYKTRQQINEASAFIVKAVNAHDELVKALREAREEVDAAIRDILHSICQLGSDGPIRDTAEPDDLTDVVRMEAVRASCDAALAKAEAP